MRIKLRYCEIELSKGFGGLKGLNQRLKEKGNLKTGDEISYTAIEKDYAVEYLKPCGHCECYPLKKIVKARVGEGGEYEDI
jgi:hypothetical protein